MIIYVFIYIYLFIYLFIHLCLFLFYVSIVCHFYNFSFITSLNWCQSPVTHFLSYHSQFKFFLKANNKIVGDVVVEAWLVVVRVFDESLVLR